VTRRTALSALAGFAGGLRSRLGAYLRRHVPLTLEQHVALRTQELQDLNDELEAFSYSVSHDLRAPLRHIDGFGELLTQRLGTGDALVTHYLDRIVDQTHQAEALIDNLLAFSRMGRVPLERHDVDMQKMVAEVQWSIERLPHVDADPAMLRVVWRNLLDNALKYTQSRASAEVEIGTSHADGQTSFFVRDNGVGFDVRFAGKLFGVFQRLHPKEEFSGSGIGLATVRRIVARHAGRTGADGSVDGGATFWFSLPDVTGELACPSPS
jgi:chemotaxis family two-component system sensor kinase Cph1